MVSFKSYSTLIATDPSIATFKENKEQFLGLYTN